MRGRPKKTMNKKALEAIEQALEESEGFEQRRGHW
jgi:hypothetical protein